jgi:hypothetical protein
VELVLIEKFPVLPPRGRPEKAILELLIHVGEFKDSKVGNEIGVNPVPSTLITLNEPSSASKTTFAESGEKAKSSTFD